MEEIVNRWNNELDTQAREFAKYANEVSAWDRTLIENSNYVRTRSLPHIAPLSLLVNQISTLHATVVDAEAKQKAVDEALDQIEGQQKELAATLDVYEKEAKAILEGQGGGLRALEQGPADAERDRKYVSWHLTFQLKATDIAPVATLWQHRSTPSSTSCLSRSCT